MRSAACVVILLATTGCFGAAAPPPGTTVEAASTSAPAGLAGASVSGPNGTLAIRDVPVALDGRTGTWAGACAAGRCAGTPFAIGGTESEVVVEGVEGRVLGGAFMLEWTANSPATQRLAYGVMLMGGGEECPSVELGAATGPSPLALEAQPTDRALCPDEVVHVWVSTATYGQAGPASYQVVANQAFRLVGTFQASAGG